MSRPEVSLSEGPPGLSFESMGGWPYVLGRLSAGEDLSATEAATVLAIHEQGRRLEVRCEGGELLEFVLNPATARFVLSGSASGPRLELLARPN